MENKNTEYKAEIMYESKGKTPNGDPFMSVKMARDYYCYAERGGQDSIAFILYDNDRDGKEQYALIYESKPPMDERNGFETRMTTAFGGSIDMGSNTTYQEICQTEVREESGYVVPLENIKSVGKTLVSTQMSQMCEGFFVDVSGIQKTEIAEYEKAASEAQSQKDANEFSGNEVHWMGAEGVMENSDWKSVFIMTQALYRDFI